MSKLDKKIDTSKLTEKLEGLRGLDYEAAEADERRTGNTAVELSFSKGFQIRLAAMALGFNVHDLKALPVKDYFKVTNEVSRFLYGGSESEETASNTSEQLQ